MSRFRPFRVTSTVSTTGALCLPLFQLVLSDPPCEDNEMFLLLIFLVALLCGIVLFCLQCWLKKSRRDNPRCTVAIFAVGDLDPIYGTEAAGSPLQTQNAGLHPIPCFGTLGPPPPYEDILKTSQL
uniref:transmembrane protein 207 isoform X2 n=1 Tax=Jaculus jaculus TaxID=51337 RepID=UPI001E1AF68E|nr:transmembrane protein 207 isoform X2 [Jaculus jaculus]